MVYGWHIGVVKPASAKISKPARLAESMARKLKTYQTSLGFYDMAIAAPSKKAALEAWGAGSNLFHQGVQEILAAAVTACFLMP
jgi:hypothetical protein